MPIVVGLLLGAVAGYLLLRRRRDAAGRPVPGRPPSDLHALLATYRRGDYRAVVAGGPAAAAGNLSPTERARLELVWGHALFQLDAFDQAVPHLEAGLGSGLVPEGEARFRHCLGFAYQATGRRRDARREYDALLADDDLDPTVRDAVARHVAELDAGS